MRRTQSIASLTLLAALLASCSQSGRQTDADSGVPHDGGSAAPDASKDAGVLAPADAGTGDIGSDAALLAYPPGRCPAPSSLPADVPPGWIRYDGVSCDFPLYLPGPNGTPLPPLEWEPSPSPVLAELGARRLKRGWGFAGEAREASKTQLWRDPNTGKAYLSMTRTNRDAEHRFVFVSELDGPVPTAALQRQIGTARVWLTSDRIGDGRYVFGVLHQGKDGFIAGQIGEPFPSLTFIGSPITQWYSAWAACSGGVVRLSDYVSRTPWDSPKFEDLRVPVSVGSGMTSHLGFGVGEDLFWELGVQNLGAVVSWTPKAGVRGLLTWPDDPTRGSAGNFCTDGTDMAWTFAEQRDADGQWGRFSVMTAPYTADPEELRRTARRVRSDHAGFSPRPTYVGCGHVARVLQWKTSYALFIVRLRDGVSWLLPDNQETSGWQFGESAGVTCDAEFQNVEVLATIAAPASWQQGSALLRISVANLGPGVPPD